MITVVITYGSDKNVITVKNALKIDTEQPIYVMTVKMNSSETSKTWNKAKGIGVIERLAFSANGKPEFVPRDQVSPSLVVFGSLQLQENRQIHANSIHKNCFKLFLAAHFSFWKFLS